MIRIPQPNPYGDPATGPRFDQRLVKSVYHDGDGSVFLYDENGKALDGWPEQWPDYIASVPTFCKARGIEYHS